MRGLIKNDSEKSSFPGDFVDVAPLPTFARLDGLHDGMFRVVEVLRRMFINGRIAASDMAANEAHAQMNPGIAGFEAFFAALRFWADFSNFLDVCASSGHGWTPRRP